MYTVELQLARQATGLVQYQRRNRETESLDTASPMVYTEHRPIHLLPVARPRLSLT